MTELDLGIPGLTDYKEIGSGGFATVYSAFEADAGRRVSVKVLRSVDERGRRRFERERRTMGQTTDHDNIVTLFRSGYTDPGNQPYMVMEYMSGGSLQDRLDTQGPLTVTGAIEVIMPVARGLAFAHSTGIVHKDIKPANILISATGVPKLSDFGIAAVRDATGTSEMAFSLAYTAPETFDGTRGPDGEIRDPRDERSDLYSLAVTLHALITGAPPFAASSQAGLIHQILTVQPPPTGHADLDAFFTTALAKAPSDRYPTATQFIEALGAVLKPPSAQPAPAEPAWAEPASSDTTIAATPATTPRDATRIHSSESATISAAAAPVSGPAGPTGPDDHEAATQLASPPLTIEPTPRRYLLPAGALLALAVVVVAGYLLTRNAAPTIATYSGHTSSVWSVVELTYGNIASASSDGTVQIWDPANPDTTITTYTGHAETVWSVVELTNGNIASAGEDGTVQIWDPANPDTTITTYTGHTNSVRSVAELTNGNIASAGEDGTVQIWDPANPDTTITTYTGHTNLVWSVAELSNGNIASASDDGESRDGTVQIWDPANPDTTITTYTGHAGSAVTSVVELTNGNIASASADGPVHIWDPANPDTTITSYTGHTEAVRSVVELTNGNIASADWLGTVHIWDPANE